MTERIGMHLVHPLKKVLWLMILAICPMAMIGFGYAEGMPAQHSGYRTPDYAAGVQAYRQGHYENAISYFRKVLIQDETNVNARYYLALALDYLGFSSEAASEYAYVIHDGQDPNIIAYSRVRLKILKPTASLAASSPSNIAMIAAGNRIAPAIYRGIASQVAVPLKNNKNALLVDATLKQGRVKTDGSFIIDTGATYTSISQEMAEELGLDLHNCEMIHITTANGRIEVPKVTIEELSVNGLKAHNVEATVIQVRKGASFSGLLGLSFIREFVLTIDPQANQLIFRRN